MEKKTRKQYSAEFKAKVVKEMPREEKTVGQLAAEYGVHSNMLYRWRDQATQELVRDARPPGSKNERLYTLKLDA